MGSRERKHCSRRLGWAGLEWAERMMGNGSLALVKDNMYVEVWWKDPYIANSTVRAGTRGGG